MGDSSSDEELLEAWSLGDDAAGQALFGRYFRPLFRFFTNKVDEGGEDLVQTTLSRCVEKREHFRGHSSFRTYVFAIARNVFIDHLRRRCKCEHIDLSELSLRDLGTTPSGAIARDEESARLLRAMTRLPLEFQIALELAYFEGMNGPEIAEVVGIPANTVRSRLARARRALRTELNALQK